MRLKSKRKSVGANLTRGNCSLNMIVAVVEFSSSSVMGLAP